jgi:hypothetical protein
MKLTYIFGAIFGCSVIGTLIGARTPKTAFLVMSAVLSLYGFFRPLADGLFFDGIPTAFTGNSHAGAPLFHG